jgi:hypothetical protein
VGIKLICLKKNLNKEQPQTCQTKTSRGGFRIKAFHCFFRYGKTGCRHLKDWTASQETLWSAEEKLVRERKMKEGTWTAEKPKGKTPPPQDKGTAGSSGGVKRPDSDSRTPSQEKQQPKKPRNTQVQTATYKEAAVGIKMVIVHRDHPDVSLDQA